MRPDDRAAVLHARSLYGQWNALSAGERDRLAPLAAELKRHALDHRGRSSTGPSGDLDRAGKDLAAALNALENAEIAASREASERPSSTDGAE